MNPSIKSLVAVVACALIAGLVTVVVFESKPTIEAHEMCEHWEYELYPELCFHSHDTPTPAPTATPRPTATPVPTPTPRPTATPRPTSTPTTRGRVAAAKLYISVGETTEVY